MQFWSLWNIYHFNYANVVSKYVFADVTHSFHVIVNKYTNYIFKCSQHCCWQWFPLKYSIYSKIFCKIPLKFAYFGQKMYKPQRYWNTHEYLPTQSVYYIFLRVKRKSTVIIVHYKIFNSGFYTYYLRNVYKYSVYRFLWKYMIFCSNISCVDTDTTLNKA